MKTKYVEPEAYMSKEMQKAFKEAAAKKKTAPKAKKQTKKKTK